MKGSPKSYVVVVLCACVGLGCASARQAPPVQPPDTSEVFAPGVISGENVFRGTMSRDQREFYYFKHVGPDRNRETYRIFRSLRGNDGLWSVPQVVDLGGDFSDLYPALSGDGERLVFSSYRPAPGDTSAHPSAYIWQSRRQRDGSWGTPVFQGWASAFGHYHSQLGMLPNGDLHFKRQTWEYRDPGEWRSRWNGDRYEAAVVSPTWLHWRSAIPENLFLWETTAGHDDSYAILVVSPRREDRNAPNGPSDLWVTLREGSGWSPARPLQAGVNSPATENFAFFTRDGSALFFVRDFKEFRWVNLSRALGRAR